MTIYCFEIVGMPQHQVVAVSTAFVVLYAHTAVECRADSVAHIDFKVYTLVHAAETAAIAVRRRDIARVRHRETAYVDSHTAGNGHIAIAVNALAVPPFGIDVKFGLLLFFKELFEVFACIFYRYAGISLIGEQIVVAHCMACRKTVFEIILRRYACADTQGRAAE